MASYGIKTLGPRGRGLVAERPIKAGEPIVSEEPLLLTVSQEAKDAACTHCLRLLQPGSSIACEGCRQAAFCSQECAAAAAAKPWVHAEATCRAYSCLAAAPLDDEGKTALRFLIQAMALRALAAQNPADGRYQELLALDGTPDAATMQQAQQLWPLLAAAIGDPAGCLGASVEEVAALLRKEQTNSYGIMAPPQPGGERALRGGGIYPRCSRVNHECAPNAARFDAFDGPISGSSAAGPSSNSGCSVISSGSGYPSSTVVTIRAIHDLPPGTEIVQSYFPLNWTLPERRRQAKRVYGFDCGCPRCLAEAQPGWAAATGGDSSDWETDDGEEEEEEENMEEGGSGAAEGQEEEEEEEEEEGVALAAAQAAAAAAGDTRGPLEATYLQLFLLKYMCPREGCFGTMAGVVGSSACECNVCGGIRTEAEFLAELEG